LNHPEFAPAGAGSSADGHGVHEAKVM
jgi:hypothetical protein